PTPPPVHIAPKLVVQYCVDSTGSYKSQYFDAANQLVANALVQRAAPGQDGAIIYVTLISANTFTSESTVSTITIAAVPAEPPPLAVPTLDTSNPFNLSNDQTTATATARQATATYTAQRGAEQAALDIAQREARDGASFLRELTQVYNGFSDVLGCVSVAAQHFASAPVGSDKLLIIASDLRRTGNQQSSSSRVMKGVRVKVINFYCDQAQECDANKTFWQNEFKSDQVASLNFYDPAETRAELPGNLFS
ncbi:MAG: hypothetical protein IVW57_17120, partial [Ktedonobacterales bacterium]|nr:hypothetical protein [Ktedonobacterales bacterium]